MKEICVQKHKQNKYNGIPRGIVRCWHIPQRAPISRYFWFNSRFCIGSEHLSRDQHPQNYFNYWSSIRSHMYKHAFLIYFLFFLIFWTSFGLLLQKKYHHFGAILIFAFFKVKRFCYRSGISGICERNDLRKPFLKSILPLKRVLQRAKQTIVGRNDETIRWMYINFPSKIFTFLGISWKKYVIYGRRLFFYFVVCDVRFSIDS